MGFIHYNRHMKLLAIDYGRKRIGLAISYATLAEPFKVIINTPNVFEEILTICQDEGITKLIVGISEQQMAIETEEFAQKLQEKVALPMQFVDETLSSQNAEKKVSESGMKMSKRRKAKDHFAAAEFLQEYLDVTSKII